MSSSGADAPTVMLDAASSPAPAHGGARGNVLAPGTRVADFEIVGLIGEGGFGIVYDARDLLLQRRVAIKEYVPSAIASRAADGLHVAVKSERHAETFAAGLESFLNEARMLARFDHPSLVKVFRFWEANGTAYMVMPRYQGGTLGEALRRRGPPDEAWLRVFLAQLLDALGTIHRGQCFHRDIAPDNILLLDADRPLLLDFGAARRVIGDMTQALTVILKPGFAPIEQYAEMPGARQGPWTDVHAVAAVVYHAITGRTPVAAVARLIEDKLPPLAEVAKGRYSPRFLQAIDRAMAVRPEARTQSVDALLADLEITGLADPKARPVDDDASRSPDAATATATADRTLLDPAEPSALLEGSLAKPATDAPRRWRARAFVASTAVTGLVAIGIAGWSSTADVASRDVPAMRPSASASATGSTSTASDAGAPAEAPMHARVATAALPASGTTPTDTAPPARLFEAIRSAGARDGKVDFTTERARLRIGRDRARLAIRSDRDGFLYVFAIGTDGAHVAQLFPNAIDADNRVRAGGRIALPRAGWAIEAAGPAGTNRLLAVVSPVPRDWSAAGLVAGHPADRPAGRPFSSFDPQVLAAVAGDGSATLLGRADCPAQAPQCDAFAVAEIELVEVSR